ncbi:MAG: sigma-54 dependent transcriptional regulator [candidate division Zixibacteria bacterium]|nr:sigma-54 dependent transcriptional regulator [candidate division Zixibacteria bacterium]
MSETLTQRAAAILVVDDDTTIREVLTVLLSKAGHQVSEAESMSAASTRLSEQSFDLTIVDLNLGDGNGIDLIRLVRQSYPDTESILLTGYGSIESSVEAMQAGAFDYITKPFSNHEFMIRVGKALERRCMRKEIVSLRQHVAMNYGFDNIVGISKQVHQVIETARRIAPTDITVLITGASGTGKELFARAIHHHSGRRHQPFVAIDCSAIPETLMESELFGHTKGSFTSATQNRKGLFEEADGGTVFLDEVSNIPPSIQVKLLRFLQDSVIRRVGSSATHKVDVRIVAATNRELSGMVAEEKFREDLYYRLNVIPLNLPTLRERFEDIEILTEYFLRRLAAELGRPSLTISREAVDRLLSHTWPGNIRELENTLKRAAVLCTSNHLEVTDIMFVASDDSAPKQPVGPSRTSLRIKGNLLDNTQRELIVKALEENGWNYTRTANDLGIGRTTLWRKIKRYDLKRDLEASWEIEENHELVPQ